MMDTQALTTDGLLELETEKAVEKFNKRQDRIIRQQGVEATDGALAIAERSIGTLAENIRAALSQDLTSRTEDRELVLVIRDLSPDVIALSVIQTLLHVVAQSYTLRDTALAIGASLANECWAAKLTIDNPRLAARIDDQTRKRHTSVTYRRNAARRYASKEGFKHRTWKRTMLLIAGNWCLNRVREALPDVFVVGDEIGNAATIWLTDSAEQWAENAIVASICKSPVYLPMIEPPRPWVGFAEGGSLDQRSRATVVRTFHKATQAAIKAAIRSGQMQPALDGLNALQATAWTINQPVLDVVKWAYTQKLKLKGMPLHERLQPPPLKKAWEDMDDGERRLWKGRAERVKRRNNGLKSDRLLFIEDVETAELMTRVGRFWTPMNLDSRGRVYGLPHFNFQREDRVRAMFMFADGEPIGEEGLYWLKVHVANCGDFGKISKRPFDERVKWVDDNIKMIEHVANQPTWDHASLFWTKANKPFLFVASAIELVNALTMGPGYVTRLPVSFDGSCSGLQHLCAMTRAPEGKLVNLTDNPVPADVYQTVADQVNCVLRAEAAAGIDKAHVWLAYGLEREDVKRNTMTYAYSSKKFGMSKQQIKDLMEPLAFDVLQGELEEHPFGDNEETQKALARYIAGHVFHAIEGTVELPAKAMTYLQKCARALAHEGKPLSWVTPVGLPWINRYHEATFTRVTLWLNDRGVKMRHDVKVATDVKPEIDKDKAANAVAPNFVHALDAAHLLLVAKAARDLGIRIATVHDSFGCLASRAGVFNRLIREQFVRMYETHDVLAEVLAQARHDLTHVNWNRLPAPIERGSLNINEVMDAKYAFA